MRRATASASSSASKYSAVHFGNIALFNFIRRLSWSITTRQWFRRSSLLKCVWQPEIAKNLLETLIFEIQARSRWLLTQPIRGQTKSRTGQLATLVNSRTRLINVVFQSRPRVDQSATGGSHCSDSRCSDTHYSDKHIDQPHTYGFQSSMFTF